jgi:hypothetical protein
MIFLPALQEKKGITTPIPPRRNPRTKRALLAFLKGSLWIKRG